MATSTSKEPDPRTPQTRSEERHAGWLELFYDLLFVVLVAQLAHPLLEHPQWQAVLRLLVLFLPAWWMWVGSTLYTNLTGEAEAERRLDVVAQMAILVVMAGAATQAAHGHPALFAGAYAASRLEVVAFRVLAGRRWPAGGANWQLIVSAALWAASIFLDPPAAYLLWALGLAVEIVPWLAGRPGGSSLRARLVEGRVESGHLVERFGLFMIIILGEGITQIVTAITANDVAASALITGLAAFAVVAVLWWLYFDFGSSAAEETLNARPEETFRLIRSVFMIGHFLPVVTLLALAAGLGGLVNSAAQDHPAGDALRLCCLALGVYLLNNAITAVRVLGYPLGRVLFWLLPNLALLLVLALLAYHLVPMAALFLISMGLALETLPAMRREGASGWSRPAATESGSRPGAPHRRRPGSRRR
ncbi:low temperature requirement protein A [Streptomyces sp. NPDC101225]|uniref:low temperature requirement protein A n=1 Tax=Streptomyces sp. NPDC101225 TaxID=3366135 RepID=UPI0038028CC6